MKEVYNKHSKLILISLSFLLIVSGCSITFSFGGSKTTHLNDSYDLIGNVERIDAKGEIILEGYIKNVSNHVDEALKLTFDLYDEDGEVVSQAFAAIDILEAGEIWKFRAHGLVDGEVSEFKFAELNSSVGFGKKALEESERLDFDHFEIIQEAEFEDSSYGTDIFGKIKNISKNNYYLVELAFAMYDQQGNVIGIAVEYLNYFFADETWSYRISGFAPDYVESIKLVMIRGLDYETATNNSEPRKTDYSDILNITDINIEFVTYTQEITGVIENLGDRDFREVQILFAVYDKRGNHFDTIFAFADDLKAGTKQSFKALSGIDADIVSFKVAIDSVH